MMRPEIRKQGTVDCDMVETTPVVHRGELYRFEYVRPGYWNNETGNSYFRFVHVNSGRLSPPFAHGYHLGNVMAEGDTLVVTATDVWDGERIDLFISRDMEHWERRSALHLPGYGLFNTSMCKARDRYVLMFEVGKPTEVAGVRFTARFAESADLHTWTLTPPECVYSRDRYTAPHCLRYLEPYFYNFYLEALPGRWEQYVVRSRDLVEWEVSPRNPVLASAEEDRRLLNTSLPQDLKDRIRSAENINNSDIDFCEYDGRLVITYSWGNQSGVEHLAQAEYDGSEADFLRGWFD